MLCLLCDVSALALLARHSNTTTGRRAVAHPVVNTAPAALLHRRQRRHGGPSGRDGPPQSTRTLGASLATCAGVSRTY